MKKKEIKNNLRLPAVASAEVGPGKEVRGLEESLPRTQPPFRKKKDAIAEENSVMGHLCA